MSISEAIASGLPAESSSPGLAPWQQQLRKHDLLLAARATIGMLPTRIASRAAAAVGGRLCGVWAAAPAPTTGVTRRSALLGAGAACRWWPSSARQLCTSGEQPASSRWSASRWRWALAAGACGAGGYAVGGQLGEARAGGQVSPLAGKLRELGEHADTWWMDAVQQLSGKHAGLKLLALAASVVPLIGVTGALYKAASGTQLGNALYRMYCLLFRIEMGKEPNTLSYVVTNIVYLLGLFTSAVLLGETGCGQQHVHCSRSFQRAVARLRAGVVNDEVQRRSDDARSGRNPVYTEDHVLILVRRTQDCVMHASQLIAAWSAQLVLQASPVAALLSPHTCRAGTETAPHCYTTLPRRSTRRRRPAPTCGRASQPSSF